MRIASFNVENLFERARALNQETWDLGRPILDQHAEINGILENKTYTPANKKRLVELIKSLGLAKSDTAKFVLLRQNHGRLLKPQQDRQDHHHGHGPGRLDRLGGAQERARERRRDSQHRTRDEGRERGYPGRGRGREPG